MSVLQTLREQSTTWVIGLAVALLGAFSSKIVEGVKFALNRADLRAGNYETLSTDVSEYVFLAELLTEHLEHGWTTRDAMVPLIEDYNASITRLRKKEFVYRSWIGQYWDQTSLDLFAETFQSILTYDQTVHRLNDDFEAVNIRKVQERIAPERVASAAKEMGQILSTLRTNANALLTALL